VITVFLFHQLAWRRHRNATPEW